MKKDYIIITNNPLVPQMLDEEHEVDYSEILMRMYWGS